MPKGVFITATDTEVGKTVVACALAAHLRQRGLDVGVSKPFASGAQRDRTGSWVNEDAILLKDFAQSSDSLGEINPVCLKSPLAPAVAAAKEGTKVDLRRALSAVRRTIKRHEFSIVEGVGGLFVPITARRMLIDLIPRIDLPVVVVARAGLGTINHTLLTVESLRKRNMTPIAVILNQCERGTNDMSLKTNAAEIQKRVPCPVFGPLPYLKNLKPGLRDRERLSRMEPIQLLANRIFKA